MSKCQLMPDAVLNALWYLLYKIFIWLLLIWHSPLIGKERPLISKHQINLFVTKKNVTEFQNWSLSPLYTTLKPNKRPKKWHPEETKMPRFCHNRKIIAWKLQKWKGIVSTLFYLIILNYFLKALMHACCKVSSQKPMANDPFLSTMNHDGDWASDFRSGYTVFCTTGENFHLPPHRLPEAYSRNLLLIP